VKGSLVVTSLLILLAGSAAAETVRLRAFRNNEVVSTNKVLYSSAEPITIRFAKPILSKDPINQTYDWLDIEDCNSRISEYGHPALPVRTVTFRLNVGLTISNVDVRVVNASLGGVYKVCPALRPVVVGKSGGGLTAPDPAIYGSSGLYPGKWSEYVIRIGLDPDSGQRIQYVTVALYPVQYVPALGKLILCEQAAVDIQHEDTPRAYAASTYNLLIITSPTLQPWASDLASYRTSMGVNTVVATTDYIYRAYSGVDNPEKIRNYVKAAVSSSGIQYLLIFGDHDQVPARLAYIPDADDSDGDLVETDLYYADLQYTWNENGDDRWGELRPIGGDSVDGVPDLYIGRLPASTTTEASNLVYKIKQYEQNVSPSSSWFKRFLLLGSGADGEALKNYVAGNCLPAGLWFSATKLYESQGTLTVPNAVAQINNGYGFVNFAGHGNPDSWGFSETKSYTSKDASGQTNEFMLPLISATACSTSRFSDYDCLGEQFLLNPNGGAIAYFGATRIAWSYESALITNGLAGEMDWRFFQAYCDGYRRIGQIWLRAVSQYVAAHGIHTPLLLLPATNCYLDWKTVADYSSPFGDPTLTIGGTTFNFWISNTRGIAVTQGGSDSNTITVTWISGMCPTVALTASGLPSGAAASFNPPSGSPTFTSICTIGTLQSTPTGLYTITVTGSGGGLARTTTFTLTIRQGTTVRTTVTTTSTTSSTSSNYGSTSVLTSQRSMMTTATTSVSTVHMATTCTRYSGSISTTYNTRATLYSTSTSLSTTTLTSSGASTDLVTQLSRTGTTPVTQISTSVWTSGNTVYVNIIDQRIFIEQFLESIISAITSWTNELTQVFQNVFLNTTVRDTTVRVEPAPKLGETVGTLFLSTSSLGFMNTGNIYDDSGIGFIYGHRNPPKVLFTKADGFRVLSTGQPTWLDYGHLVTVGGRAANPTIKYYEDQGLAPLRYAGTATNVTIVNGTGGVKLNIPLSSINQGNDYFAIEVISDGTHKVIIMWGIAQWGTYAAGVYFDGKYPDMASLTYSWYIIRWQDLNSNGIPDYPTEFGEIASGT